MNKCEKCAFYNKEYDDALESDVISEKERKHFCVMHHYGISAAVWNGKSECSDYININAVK